MDECKPLLLGATGPLTPANAGGVNIDPPSTADEYPSEEAGPPSTLNPEPQSDSVRILLYARADIH